MDIEQQANGEEFKEIFKMVKNLEELSGKISKSNSFDSAKISKKISEIMELLSTKPDPNLVFNWAEKNNIENAFDMGPKNWERCLYDLGFPGGKKHELKHDSDGRLIKQ